MHAQLGETFRALQLTGTITIVSETFVYVEFGMMGFLTLSTKCEGRRESVMTIAVPEFLHSHEQIEEIRRCAFIGFSVPETESWLINVCALPTCTLISENSGDHIEFVSTG